MVPRNDCHVGVLGGWYSLNVLSTLDQSANMAPQLVYDQLPASYISRLDEQLLLVRQIIVFSCQNNALSEMFRRNKRFIALVQ